MKPPYCVENKYSIELLRKFIALTVLTSLFTLLVGNLLLLDISTFITSIHVEVIVLLIVFSIFTVASIAQNIAWGVAIVYLFMVASALTNFEWLNLFIVAGGFYGLINFIKSLKINNSLYGTALLKAAVLGTLVIISTKTYVSFDMLDKLAVGDVHLDTLFHASIASMIKTYGIASTGLHGLIPIPYHTLSHSLFATISELSGTSTLVTYGLATPLLFIPLLIGSIAYTATIFNGADNFFKYYMLTGFVISLAPVVFYSWALFGSYLFSESYLIALALLVFSLPLLFKQSYKYSDLALTLIMLSLMTLSKASVGAIFFGLLITRTAWFIRDKNEIVKELLLIVAATFIVYVALKPAISLNVSIINNIECMELIKIYSLLGGHINNSIPLAIISITLFIAFHFFSSWLTIRSRITSIGAKHSMHDPITIYTSAAIFGGLLIVALPIFPRSTAYYFSNIAMFVSLPWFIIYLSKIHLKITNNPYIVGMLIILIFKSPYVYRQTLFIRDQHPDPEHVSFINKLININNSYSEEHVFKLNSETTNNPVTKCMAQPFVLPAISERVWINSIDINDNCSYKYYGYESYFINNKREDGLRNPKIPKDINIVPVDL